MHACPQAPRAVLLGESQEETGETGMRAGETEAAPGHDLHREEPASRGGRCGRPWSVGLLQGPCLGTRRTQRGQRAFNTRRTLARARLAAGKTRDVSAP